MKLRKKIHHDAEVFTDSLNDILFILLMFFLIVSTLANPNVIKLSQPKSKSDTKAKQLGITPLARIVSSGVSGLNPEIMGLGPIEAIRQALGRAKMTMKDIDLVEINEAFAAQVIPSAKHLGIDIDRQLNVHGGAIALGHPFGMTGARIMTTLINGLQFEDKTYGLESMCVGGGQGMAMIIERLS